LIALAMKLLGESLAENDSIRRAEKERTLRWRHIAPEIYFVILERILKESQLNRPLRKDQNVDNIEICQQSTKRLTTNSKLQEDADAKVITDYW
jgi:hypothetical protein